MLKSFKSIVLSVVLFMLAVVPVQAEEVLGKQIPDGEYIYPIFEVLPENTFTVNDTIVINGSTYVAAKEFSIKAGYKYREYETGVNFYTTDVGRTRTKDTDMRLATDGCCYFRGEYNDNFSDHLETGEYGRFNIKDAPKPVKRNNKWYVDAKLVSRLINNDYTILPTFNADKTVTFTSNLNVLIKCVGYVKQTVIYGERNINENHYF